MLAYRQYFVGLTMPQKVMLVVPVIGEHLYQERLKYLKSIGMEVAVSVIEKGSSSIESSYDTAFSVPDTLRKIIEAEEKGYQAVVGREKGER